VTDEQQRDTPAGGNQEEPEPNATGTVFLMVVFLMATIGLWVIMYLKLLGR
jgi:hypothetical protein